MRFLKLSFFIKLPLLVPFVQKISWDCPLKGYMELTVNFLSSEPALVADNLDRTSCSWAKANNGTLKLFVLPILLETVPTWCTYRYPSEWHSGANRDPIFESRALEADLDPNFGSRALEADLDPNFRSSVLKVAVDPNFGSSALEVNLLSNFGSSALEEDLFSNLGSSELESDLDPNFGSRALEEDLGLTFPILA